MIFIFTRRPTLVSWAIQTVDGGHYSHVAVLDDSGDHVVEAAFPGGVRRRRLDSFLSAHPDREVVSFRVPNETAGYEFLEQQIGKPYDIGAALWLPFRGGVDDPRAWFCAELALATAYAAGRGRIWSTAGVRRAHTAATFWSGPLA